MAMTKTQLQTARQRARELKAHVPEQQGQVHLLLSCAKWR